MNVQVEVKIESMLQEEKLNAVVCVAGGWAGGNAASQGMSGLALTSRTLCL